jgi:hypothetical protein
MHELAFLLQNLDPDAARKIGAIMLLAIPIIVVVCLAIVIIPTWFICKKAGFSPWLSLLYLVPLGGLVLLYILAFAQWKVVPLDQVAMAPPPPYPPQPPAPLPQPPAPQATTTVAPQPGAAQTPTSLPPRV